MELQTFLKSSSKVFHTSMLVLVLNLETFYIRPLHWIRIYSLNKIKICCFLKGCSIIYWNIRNLEIQQRKSLRRIFGWYTRFQRLALYAFPPLVKSILIIYDFIFVPFHSRRKNISLYFLLQPLLRSRLNDTCGSCNWSSFSLPIIYI